MKHPHDSPRPDAAIPGPRHSGGAAITSPEDVLFDEPTDQGRPIAGTPDSGVWGESTGAQNTGAQSTGAQNTGAQSTGATGGEPPDGAALGGLEDVLFGEPATTRGPTPGPIPGPAPARDRIPDPVAADEWKGRGPRLVGVAATTAATAVVVGASGYTLAALLLGLIAAAAGCGWWTLRRP